MMSEIAPNPPPTVLPAARVGLIKRRFGEAVEPGFVAVPIVLTLHQSELGLSSEQLNVLLNLLSHWYEQDRMPFPKPETIAKRMGVSQRTVQRLLSELITKGWIIRLKGAGPMGVTTYDLDPLVQKLVPFAKRHCALYPKRTAPAT